MFFALTLAFPPPVVLPRSMACVLRSPAWLWLRSCACTCASAGAANRVAIKHAKKVPRDLIKVSIVISWMLKPLDTSSTGNGLRYLGLPLVLDVAGASD